MPLPSFFVLFCPGCPKTLQRRPWRRPGEVQSGKFDRKWTTLASLFRGSVPKYSLPDTTKRRAFHPPHDQNAQRILPAMYRTLTPSNKNRRAFRPPQHQPLPGILQALSLAFRAPGQENATMPLPLDASTVAECALAQVDII